MVELDFPVSSLQGWIMRRMLVVGLLLLAGCQNTTGPIANHWRPRPDNPEYSIPKQESLGRDRYALPEDSYSTGPKTGISAYGPTGR